MTFLLGLVSPNALLVVTGRCSGQLSLRNSLLVMGFGTCSQPHITPPTKGQAERAVQFIKSRLKKVLGDSMSVRLSRILMNFRRTPLAIQGVSPAEMLLNRQIRCRLDLVHSPTRRSNTLLKKTFGIGEGVYFRNYASGERWVPGTIEDHLGNKMYQILRPNGTVAERHTDQMRVRHEVVQPSKDGVLERTETPPAPVAEPSATVSGDRTRRSAA